MLTPSLDLRSGTTPWEDDAWRAPSSDLLPGGACDVAIVGGGITGAILAERLSADGRSVVVLDRRSPGMGSTAASTAQIMWAMDVPLSELAAQLGEDEAARRWRRVHEAVIRFGKRLDNLGIDCRRMSCPTVYLEGARLDAAALAAEADLHLRHGLPSRFFGAADTAARFVIAPRAAIVSDGGFALDPVRACHGLLARARERGTRLCHPVNVASLSEQAGGVRILLAGGDELRVQAVIIATGYERADLFLPPAFALNSTFVIATAPNAAPCWRERAMIWEASDPYLYLRADEEGRVIAGGEDEAFADAERRDRALPAKAAIIARKVGALLGADPPAIDRSWSATFGVSPDGFPAIGRASAMQHTWLAAGYGGNGIAFSALAAELIAAELSGASDPLAHAFDPYRV